MLIVDGHEDLAWNMMTFGRDYTLSAAETRARERGTQVPAHNGHTMLGWPDWIRGRVAVIFATLFAAPGRRGLGAWDTQCYADPHEAHQRYRIQLERYRRLVEEHPGKFHLIHGLNDLEAVLAGWQAGEAGEPGVGLVILMEGADGVRDPGELPEWFAGGVRILGPAWAGNRYVGGTGEPGPLTPEGRDLLDGMAELGMILDLSHLAEEAALYALDAYPGVLVASHSNARALLPESRSPDRHLSDLVIRRIAEREGVVGIVLGNRFLKGGWQPSEGRQAVTLNHVTAQIDHVCQLTGDARHAALGSDFDGGFGLEAVPSGLDSVADLRLIGEALGARGYSPKAVEAVLGGNWLNLLRRALPEA
jgi:membrane dipeptidase